MLHSELKRRMNPAAMGTSITAMPLLKPLFPIPPWAALISPNLMWWSALIQIQWLATNCLINFYAIKRIRKNSHRNNHLQLIGRREKKEGVNLSCLLRPTPVGVPDVDGWQDERGCNNQEINLVLKYQSDCQIFSCCHQEFRMFRHFLINPIYHNLLCFLLFIVEDLKVRPLSRSVWRKSNSHIQVTFMKCTLISAPPSSLFVCPSVISITGNTLVRFKLGGRAELGPIKNLLNYGEEPKLSSRINNSGYFTAITI